MREAYRILRVTWGIGEKIYEYDCERRVKIFGISVSSVLTYGLEVCGWKAYERVMNLKWWTPEYIAREEITKN